MRTTERRTEGNSPNIQTPPILLSFTLSDFQAFALKSGMFWKPNTYLKIAVRPSGEQDPPASHHYRESRRTGIVFNNCNPVWHRETLNLVALPSDILDIRVKDKFAIFPNLGRLSIPVQVLLDIGSIDDNVVAYTLERTSPTEHVSGELQFSFLLESSSTTEEEELPQCPEGQKQEEENLGEGCSLYLNNGPSQIHLQQVEVNNVDDKVLNVHQPKIQSSPPVSIEKFRQKRSNFYRDLLCRGYGQGRYICVNITREGLLESAFKRIMYLSPPFLSKRRLYVMFKGEAGFYQNAISREFFCQLSRMLFNPSHGLFEYVGSHNYAVQISPNCLARKNHLKWFRFCGRILAMAMIHRHLLPVTFTQSFYKALLKQQHDLSDVKDVDLAYHQSLKWMMENDITDVLDCTFTVA
ncbi:E3 ubiquitin-protein ligase HECW1-like [Denticeps clupeoides]|uniref:E3 ubiquitin-protein ligase HECW1-like n=1 Tax=Denticeps clupeoides TaxID=299321 RepID=UPI0010A3525A|nr:E3 ubiquitin-protein ligase HECW1-like [Denticeps clupeoides]XP_028822020.1 E3 ubiquitin-protein ligase HECW1-like [Denticeps clupeoides]